MEKLTDIGDIGSSISVAVAGAAFDGETSSVFSFFAGGCPSASAAETNDSLFASVIFVLQFFNFYFES